MNNKLIKARHKDAAVAGSEGEAQSHEGGLPGASLVRVTAKGESVAKKVRPEGFRKGLLQKRGSEMHSHYKGASGALNIAGARRQRRGGSRDATGRARANAATRHKK